MVSLLDDISRAAASVSAYAQDLVNPTLRLGVTGLSRAGKTVFITALVNGLLKGAAWPMFEPQARGRILGARLVDQPDDGVPRFPLEDHLRALSGDDRRWPEGTSRVSELRLEITFDARSGWLRGSRRKLTLDIVDYPGEWLLDLPLLAKSYRDWSSETLEKSRVFPRVALAQPFLDMLAKVDPAMPPDEDHTAALARAFTDYLSACRDDSVSLSSLPPGRFLMPGDMAGSPALTFVPLPLVGEVPEGSLAAQMERRYESYKRLVVQPFFRDHFATLDRQIVLIDVLAAINAGPDALSDLERALAEILTSFRHGNASLLSQIFARRIDKVLFAATKADHLHHSNHDRLQAILAHATGRAVDRVAFSGAEVETLALAAIRATRETTVTHAGEKLASIIGVPLEGERIDGRLFDGGTEAVIFPGDLPADPQLPFRAGIPKPDDYHFPRFRPPQGHDWGQIRLDRAVQFLIGDRLT